MEITSVDAFLAALAKSKLFTAEQMEQLRRHLPSDNNLSPRKLAKVLVKRGLLTPWQSEELMTGRAQFVLGKFKLLEQVGKGGRGEVYKAEQLGLGRIVALKVLPPKLMEKREAVQRFEREAKVAAALNHPNIITCYDAECAGDSYFLVMEYLEGDDLNKWLSEHTGPLPINWCCECIRQASLGLQHAHEKHMVHRDIKPSNIMVAGTNMAIRPVVKILDMGFARMTTEEETNIRLTGNFQTFGTPEYMSPEQAESTRNADIRSDIYSLGVTLYKLLTGELPFAGGSPLQMLVARASRDAPRVKGIRSDIPEGVDEIVAKMLARKPDERFQTPMEVSQALAPYSMGDSDTPEPTPATAPAPAALTEAVFAALNDVRESKSIEPVAGVNDVPDMMGAGSSNPAISAQTAVAEAPAADRSRELSRPRPTAPLPRPGSDVIAPAPTPAQIAASTPAPAPMPTVSQPLPKPRRKLDLKPIQQAVLWGLCQGILVGGVVGLVVGLGIGFGMQSLPVIGSVSGLVVFVSGLGMVAGVALASLYCVAIEAFGALSKQWVD